MRGEGAGAGAGQRLSSWLHLHRTQPPTLTLAFAGLQQPQQGEQHLQAQLLAVQARPAAQQQQAWRGEGREAGGHGQTVCDASAQRRLLGGGRTA